jgi:MoxR-like ATPase
MVNETDLKILREVEKEIAKVVVGQNEAVRSIIRAVLCNGHVLVEGVPGIAKTLLVKTIAKVMGCSMKRIQFTVDLLPTDITGITTYSPKKGFEVVKGPIFANFVLADEINRAPSKTQSALLEAMQEKQVTISTKTYPLPVPFFVLATENPLEVAGVYALPEAQVDRFLFKLIMLYPKFEDEIRVLTQNTSIREFNEYNVKSILSPEKIIELQSSLKNIYSSRTIEEYIVKIVDMTRSKNFHYAKYISYGASPRASIALYIASKAEAMLNGRDYVIPKDVKVVSKDVLRHRIILNYEAEADRITSEKIIDYLLEEVKAV